MDITAKINLEFSFADSTTRKIELGPYQTSDSYFQSAKEHVLAFNPTPIASYFLSENGASCTGISAASVVVTRDEEISLTDED